MLFSSPGQGGKDWIFWIVGMTSIIALQLLGILIAIRIDRVTLPGRIALQKSASGKLQSSRCLPRPHSLIPLQRPQSVALKSVPKRRMTRGN